MSSYDYNESKAFLSDEVDDDYESSFIGKEMACLDTKLTHCHSENYYDGDGKAKKMKMQLIFAASICFAFMLIEAVGGYLANSLAVMADAAHMLSDLTAFLIALLAVVISQKAPSQKLTYGCKRSEVLGALFSILLIWLLTGILLFCSIERLLYQDFDVDANSMMIVSGIGVIMNIVLAVVLHGCCSSVSHHHSHSHNVSTSRHGHSNNLKQKTNINIRAALIHVFGDLIQSIGVFIAALVIKFKPEYKLADPISTFLFSALVLMTTGVVFKDTITILMEGLPDKLKYKSILSDLKTVPGIKALHDFHIWPLTSEEYVVTAHLAIDRSFDSVKVVRQASEMLKSRHNTKHVTLQAEWYDVAMETCISCVLPTK